MNAHRCNGYSGHRFTLRAAPGVSRFLALVVLVAGHATATRALDYNWIEANPGVFSAGVNWNHGAAPSTTDNAVFDLHFIHSVDLTAHAILNRLVVREDEVEFNLAGDSITTSSTSNSAPGFTFGDEYLQTAGVTFRNGTLNGIGHVGASYSTATVTLKNVTWHSTSQTVRIGEGSFGGWGILQLVNGSNLNTRGVNVNSGYVSLVGAGVSLTTSATPAISISGTGSGIYVDSGALLDTRAASTFCYINGGHVTVGGADSKWRAADGAANQTSQIIRGLLNIHSGGYMEGAWGELRGSGNASVSGVGSKILARQAWYIGAENSVLQAVLRVENGGVFEARSSVSPIQSDVGLKVATATGSNGRITVSGSGALLKVADLDVGTAGNGYVYIESGATVDVYRLHIAGTTSASPTGHGYVVLNGGTLNVWGGGILIHPNGTLNFNGGTLTGAAARITNHGTITGAVTLATSGGVHRLAGTGAFQQVTVGRGGVLSPGNSPGPMSGIDATFGPGGVFLLEINNAVGTAGASPGWDHLQLGGELNIAALPNDKFVLDIDSLTLANAVGTAANFNSALPFDWDFVTATGGILGFDPAKFELNTSGFLNPLNGGTFSVVQSGNSLSLHFAPVPEPGSLLLLIAGLTVFGAFVSEDHQRKARL